MQKANKLKIYDIPMSLSSARSAEDYCRSTGRTLSSLSTGYKQFSGRPSSFNTVVMYHQILFSFWLSGPVLM